MNDALPLFPVLLPTVPFDERQRLPQVSGIYFALTEDGDVLYIGATQNLRHRWNAHSQVTKLQTLGCASIAFYACEISHLAKTEQAMIAQFQPPLNAVGEHAYKPSRLMDSLSSLIYVSLRMEKPMHAALSQRAKQDGNRSLHSLIIAALDQFLTTQGDLT